MDLAVRLAGAGDAAGTPIRALGGVAVAMRAGHRANPHRALNDLDVIGPRKDRRSIERALREAGLTPEARFNALHGHARQIWRLRDALEHVDVFLGRFEMCHRLDLDERLRFPDPALNATDLLLTKLQIVELNHKDVLDAAELLRTHYLGDEDERGVINGVRLSEVLGSDWGFHTTVMDNLDAVPGHVARLELSDAGTIAAVAADIRALLRDCRKTPGFHMRRRVGRKVRWYRLPDESLA